MAEIKVSDSYDGKEPATAFAAMSRRSFVKSMAVATALGQGCVVPSSDGVQIKRVGSTVQRVKSRPYEMRVCRFENYPESLSHRKEYKGISLEDYVELIAEAGLDVQIVAGEVDRGTPRFHSRMLPPHPDVDHERLPRFLELAHKKGILCLAYYPLSYCKPLKKLHPEWMMKFLDDGRPYPENLGWFCFNSPYRDWVSDYLIEWMDNLDLDGIYFDDMNWGTHESWPWTPSCCCGYCEGIYRKDSGRPIPTKVDMSSIDFKRFVNWRYEKLKDVMAHVTLRVREKHPDAIMDYNYYGRHYGDWAIGHPLNPLGLEKVGAYFFMETYEPYDGTSFTAKVGRAHGSPFGLWRHPTQAIPEAAALSSPYPESLSPILYGLAALMNGGGAVYGMFDGPVEMRRDLMKSICTEVKKRVDYMGGQTVKYLALHYSQQVRDFGPDSGPEQVLRISRGAYDMLNESHLLVDVVFDSQLTMEKLSPYRVLFLSESTCLSDEQCRQIRGFATRGGTVIATGRTSLYDEFGVQRDNFALADLFGVDYRGPEAGGKRHGVLYVPQTKALKQFGYIIAFAGHDWQVSLRGDARAKVLCTRSSLKGSEPLNDFDSKGDYDSGQPTVVMNHVGKGKVIYISGDVGGGYIHNPHPPLKRFIAQLVGRSRPPIEFEAPRVIEVAAAVRDNGQLMIHLLNNPNRFLPFTTSHRDLRSHFFLQEINPIRDVRIRLNDFGVKAARLGLQNRFLPVAGNPPTLVVPEVKLHEVVLLDLAG